MNKYAILVFHTKDGPRERNYHSLAEMTDAVHQFFIAQELLMASVQLNDVVGKIDFLRERFKTPEDRAEFARRCKARLAMPGDPAIETRLTRWVEVKKFPLEWLGEIQ